MSPDTHSQYHQQCFAAVKVQGVGCWTSVSVRVGVCVTVKVKGKGKG